VWVEKKMDMKYYEGKKVYVKLNSDRVYSGTILEVIYQGKDSFGIDIWMFYMKDKYDSMVTFTNKDLKLLEEEKNNGNRNT